MVMEGEGEVSSTVEAGLVAAVDTAVTEGAAADTTLPATDTRLDVLLDAVAVETSVSEADDLQLLPLTIAVLATTEPGADKMLLNEGSLAVTKELAVTV